MAEAQQRRAYRTERNNLSYNGRMEKSNVRAAQCGSRSIQWQPQDVFRRWEQRYATSTSNFDGCACSE
jgi:hypothetical protein